MSGVAVLLAVAGGLIGALLVLAARELGEFVIWTVGETIRSRRGRRARRCEDPGCRKQGTISHWTDAAEGIELATEHLCPTHAQEVNQ